MRQPLVSVVIATYNSGTYLREAIESVLRQSVGELELLVIDDGSTDGTSGLVKSIGDARLSYFWQANAGQTAAKNHGLRRANGRFVGFCDGDDYWYPDKLELQLPLFEKSSLTGVVYSPADTIDEHGQPLPSVIPAYYRGDVTNELFLTNFVPFGTALVRRECLDRVGSFDDALAMGIDWDLWLRISAHYHFDYVPRATYAYRIWSGQMSKNWRGRYTNAFRIMDKFTRSNPGKIPPSIKRFAFASTYSNRARARMHEHPVAAISDASHGLVLSPLDLYSWKTLGRTVVNATQTRGGSNEFERRGDRYHIYKRLGSPLIRKLTCNLPRIFMYHRFGRKPAERTLGVDEFRNQMVLLKKRCEILTLSELLDSKNADVSKDGPRATITIDDGYGDFIRFAAPVLRELGIRATIFVTTGFVDRTLHLWPDIIRSLLSGSPNGTYRIGGFWNGMEITLGSDEEREKAWHRLADQLIFSDVSTRSNALADLARSLKLSVEDCDMSAFEALTWQELQKLHDEGFEIGDHSHTHACLTAMSTRELHDELATSKKLLEDKLQTRIQSFAYPNGTPRDYDARVVDIVRGLGYEQAVLSYPSAWSRGRRFEIGRFSGTCSQEQFENLVDGYGMLHIR